LKGKLEGADADLVQNYFNGSRYCQAKMAVNKGLLSDIKIITFKYGKIILPAERELRLKCPRKKCIEGI